MPLRRSNDSRRVRNRGVLKETMAEGKDLMTRTTKRAIVKLFNVELLPPDDRASCRQWRQFEAMRKVAENRESDREKRREKPDKREANRDKY